MPFKDDKERAKKIADMSKMVADNSLDLETAMTTDVELDYVLPGFLRKTVGIMVAPGATGKSYVSLQLAISIALGKDVFGLFDPTDEEEIEQGLVLVINVEDPQEAVHDRFRRMHNMSERFTDDDIQKLKANVKMVTLYGEAFGIAERDENGAITMSGEWEALMHVIRDLKPRLVILDTLNRMSGGAAENDNGEMGRVLSYIEKLNKFANVSTLLLHHTNKTSTLNGRGDEQQAGRGASVVTDNGRWQANLRTMTKEEAEPLEVSEDARRNWVKLTYSKINYGPGINYVWLQRRLDGTLHGHPLGPEGDAGSTPVPEKPQFNGKPHKRDPKAKKKPMNPAFAGDGGR